MMIRRKNQNDKLSGPLAAAMAAGMMLFLAGCSDTQGPVEITGFSVPVEIQAASIAAEVETRASDVKNLEQGSIGLCR